MTPDDQVQILFLLVMMGFGFLLGYWYRGGKSSTKIYCECDNEHCLCKEEKNAKLDH